MAAIDYFLKIEGVEGESLDTKHRAEIDVLSWSFAEQQQVDLSAAPVTPFFSPR